MSYDVIVRFPTKELADEWCGQMSDGFGENLCDFSYWEQIQGTDGTRSEHFRKVTSAAPEGTPVFFVNEIFAL
jgi:hypothetical protein